MIADRLERERANEATHDLGDSHALATVLMDAALHAMERDVRAIVAGQALSDAHATVLVDIWYRAIYSTGATS